MNVKLIGAIAAVALVGFVLVIGFKYSVYGFTGNFKKIVCDARGGKLLPIGDMDTGRYVLTCFTPHKDAGEPCTGPGQCSGACVVKSPDVPLPVESRSNPVLSVCTHSQIGSFECPGTVVFSGKCEDNETLGCLGFWQLMDGNKIQFNQGVCPPID